MVVFFNQFTTALIQTSPFLFKGDRNGLVDVELSFYLTQKS